jgi:hypothetical protein
LMTHRRYIPSSTKSTNFDFYLKAKLNVNGKLDSMVIGWAFMG